MPGIHSPITVESLTRRLGLLNCAEWAQDWPAGASDASRVEEFIDFYDWNKEAMDPQEKRATVDLILCSFEDLRSNEANGGVDDLRRERIESILQPILLREFELHKESIKYWSFVGEWHIDGQVESEQFYITPFMLKIWRSQESKGRGNSGQNSIS